MTVLYHFTTRAHLRAIAESGRLKCTESNVSIDIAHFGPDVVWLTDHPALPMGAAGWSRMVDADGREVGRADKSEVRFEVDAPDAERWSEWVLRQGMDRNWRRTMVRTGGGKDAASRWWVSEKPIPRSRWISVVRTSDGADLLPSLEKWAKGSSVQGSGLFR